ncbi:DUF309 domain-containing protein [Arcobacteraceae bacterium]|nr:DUF309 domain-containing protein [Arcobacteraceae bacterium]
MKEIEKFKQLINQKFYYEAHESLEELWFPIRKSKDDYCLVLKGFINAAVSLELYKRDKLLQCKKIYLVYNKYVTENRMLKTKKYKKFRELKDFIDKKFEEIEIKTVVV